MISNQAREQRRKVIERLRTALRTISAGNACLRSIESCEAMAMAYQCLGRLAAIDEQECYDEACSQGKPARSPRPSIIPDPFRPGDAMTTLSPEQRAAVERMCYTVSPAIVPHVASDEQLKSMSYGERMARQPYVPESIAIPESEVCSLTDDQIYEAAHHKAVRDEPSMPDAVLEAITEAWDRGDIDTTQSIVNAVAANGRAV